MARIVCQVLHRPNRVTFIWSEGAASFEPYHLDGPEVDHFYQIARTAHRHLARLMQGADAETSVELAKAGQQLYQAIFRHNANDPQAKEIQQWLQELRDRNNVTSLDMLSDAPGRIPWNVVYDQEPAFDSLRAGDPAAVKAYWGFRYALAAGKRVNPLRVACLLDSPSLLLVADPGLLGKVPEGQRNLLSDWAIANELTIVESGTDLREQLRQEAPDVLYIFARFEKGAFHLGDDAITISQLRDLLAGAKGGNPDPIVLLQVTGDTADLETWECYLSGAVNTLSGLIACEVPASPALANVLGVEMLTRFFQHQGLGQAAQGARDGHGLAALAYSAFCPSHVKIASDESTDPDVAGPEPLPLPEYPYRSLVPYESEDRGLFTGREDDTVRCASLLDEAATRGLVLHGAGGIGKSSFIRAGLVPHLETEAVGFLALRDRTPEEEIGSESDYPVVALRPGYDILGQLCEALCAFCAQPYCYTTPTGRTVTVDLPAILHTTLAGKSTTAITSDANISAPKSEAGEISATDLWRMLREDTNHLAGFLDKITCRLPVELLLVFEQGEDLMRVTTPSGKEKQNRALQILSGLLASAARCKVIVAMRTEYLGRLMDPLSHGSERWRAYYLDEMTAEQMHQAILLPTAMEPIPYCDEIPRQKYQFTFEPELAGQLVHEARKAAAENNQSALALLQTLCADLYDRMAKRHDHVITKKDHKNQGPAEAAVTNLVAKRIKDLPITPSDRKTLRKLMDELCVRQADGSLMRGLVPAEEVAKTWSSATPVGTVLDAAAEEGLVEVNQMLVEGRPDVFVSLPQDALARTTAQWDEERRRSTYGRTQVVDTLWIMIPLMILVIGISFYVARTFYAVPAFDGSEKLDESVPYYKVETESLRRLLKEFGNLQKDFESNRWFAYQGDLVRADQAWKDENPWRARQILISERMNKSADLRDFEWFYLWNKIIGSGPLGGGHKGEITSVALAPDGTTGVSASTDGAIKVWNLAKGEEIATLSSHVGPVLAVAFSPDGKMIASGGSDKIIRLWNTPASQAKPLQISQPQKTLTGHTGDIRALVFGAGGLISGGDDKLVITWDLATGKEATIFKGHAGAVRALALAPDGKIIASAGADQVILIHDGTKTLQTIKTPGTVDALAFSPDGKILASGGTDTTAVMQRGLIHFWDASTGMGTGTPIQHASGIFALAYLPNSKLLVSAGKDDLLRLWDPGTGRMVSYYEGHNGWVKALAVSTTGTALVSGGRDGGVKFWNSLSPDVIQAHQGAGLALQFAFNDKVLISGGKDGAVAFWDPATGKLLTEFKGLGLVTSLSLTTKDNTGTLAAGTWTDKDEGEVHMWNVTWDAKDGFKTKDLPTLKGHTKGVTCVRFSPDGKTLASGSSDKTAILWDVAAGKQKYVLKGHEGEVRCLAFAANGSTLMTGGAKGKIRQWSVEDGKDYQKPLQVHSGPVNAVGYYFGAVGFTTAGDDLTTKFWAWNTEQEPKLLKIQQSNAQAVTSLAFSPNGHVLAAGSLDQSIRLYDSEINSDDEPTSFFAKERYNFTDMQAPVRALAFSRNSLILAAASDDGVIRIWRAAAPK